MKEKKVKKILCIEDDRALRWLLEKTLTKAGFDVYKEKNGEKGLQTAFSIKPDIILLDIVMPKMDGLSVVNSLRIDAWGKKIPLFIWSNVPKEEIRDILKKKNCYYMSKTEWSMEAMVNEVQKQTS